MTEDTRQAPKDMIGFLDYYLVQKAPFQIPAAGREWIVKFGPWIALVLLILSLPAILMLVGLGTVFGTWGYGYGYGYGFAYWPAMILLIVSVGLTALALPGLFARKMSGWTLLFYAQIANAVSSILFGNIVSALIWALIAFYILFQVRAMYKS